MLLKYACKPAYSSMCVLSVKLQGVLGMSWCPQDHSLLLSCSKDNRTICWDVNTTDVVCELPSQDNWNFDVQVQHRPMSMLGIRRQQHNLLQSHPHPHLQLILSINIQDASLHQQMIR